MPFFTMRSALRQDEKPKGEMRCMKAKLLFAMVSLAVVLTSSSFLADAGKAPSLYADKMITTDKEARV